MSGADMEEFLEAYVRGWGIPDAAREPFKANVRSWPDSLQRRPDGPKEEKSHPGPLHVAVAGR